MATHTIDIEKIAELSNLNLSDEQLKKLKPQLAQILEYVEKLNQVETSEFEGTARVTHSENILSTDQPKKSLSQDEALSNAKLTENGQFKVSAILDNE